MRRHLSLRFVVLLGLVAVFACALVASERSAATMSTAATRFLASLTPDERQRASFPFESAERLHWNFIPTDIFPRNGLTIKDMTEAQRALARELLKTGLSQRGYLTATAIMDLENILGALEAAGASSEPRPGTRMVRDPERYFFSVFGTPAPRGTWGWRVEGHHVSLHFTVVDGALVAGSPSFFGTNPAEVREGPKKGLRILADEEDAARALMTALDPPRRAKAILNIAAPGDIVTMTTLEIKPLAPAGLMASDMTASQRDLLMKLIEVYSGYMEADIAADRTAKLQKAGVEKIGFAWAGDLTRGQKHYYRVQGPSFLIEYDNTQNDANHIHSVWRDFDGDFGRDLLREHVRGVAH